MANIIKELHDRCRSVACLLHLVLATSLLLASGLAAAQWRVEPIIKVGGEYDDNATLDDFTDQEITLQGYLLEGTLDMRYASQLTSFNFTPRVLSRNYSDNPEYESTDVFVNSRFDRQMQFSSIGFRVNYDQQTVRTAERADADLDSDDPDDITGDDSGRVGLIGDREKWRITPNWAYRFSESSTISAELDYFDVNYDDVFADLLTDYTDARLNVSFRPGYSERSAFLMTATGRHMESDRLGTTSVDGAGLLVGLDRTLSQTTRVSAMVGVENTDDDTDAVSEVVGNVTLIRNLETINILAQYRRSISASGAGRVSSRDQINVNFNRRLNQKISAGIGISAYHSQGLGDTVSIDDRDYVQLRTMFSWYLTPAFVVEADYRYTILDRGDAVGERANSNHVTLWFIYQPNTVN
jgi:hypothetical protein